MEIEFKDLLYAQNNNVVSGYVYLKEFNYIFKSGVAYALLGDASEVVAKLAVLDKRPTKGSVLVNGNVIKKTAKIENFEEIKKDLVYIDFASKYKFVKNNFRDELVFWLNRKKMIKNVDKLAVQSLMMVGLDETFLDKNLWNLSSAESKKVLLALNLCLNPKVLVIKDIDYGLVYKDRLNIKRLLIKLKSRYDKMLFILSSNCDFLIDLVDKVLVINNGEIILDGNKDVFYNNLLYKYIKKPKIIEFIKYANNKGHELLPYTDIKELIKAIYRDVENKR